jgi:PIN domain nuclease of toxin-antitoxin system
MPTLAVLDTHTLIGAAGGQRGLLGRRARRFIDSVEEGRAAAYVPTIALVEIGEAVRRGTVSFDAGYEFWVEQLARSGRYHVVDLTLAVVLRAHELCGIPETGRTKHAASHRRCRWRCTRDPGARIGARRWPNPMSWSRPMA